MQHVGPFAVHLLTLCFCTSTLRASLRIEIGRLGILLTHKFDPSKQLGLRKNYNIQVFTYSKHCYQDLLRVLASQSRPSYRPSPVVADDPWTNHVLLVRFVNPRSCATWDTGAAIGKSCLLAKTRSGTWLNSGCFNNFCKASAASVRRRSRSLESTTQISASVLA